MSIIQETDDIDNKEINLISVFGETIPTELVPKFHELIQSTNSQYTQEPIISEDGKSYRFSYETYDNAMIEQWQEIMDEYRKANRFSIAINKIKSWVFNFLK